MLETGNSLLFEVAGGDNFVRGARCAAAPGPATSRCARLLLLTHPSPSSTRPPRPSAPQAPYPNSNPYAGAGGGYTGGPAAYSQHHYYERPGAGRPQAGYAPQGNSWQQQQQQYGGGGGGGYDQQYTY